MAYNSRLSHGVLVIAGSFNPIPHYQPESFSSRADNGGGLIYVIICLSHIQFHYFNAFGVKNVSKTEKWRIFALRHASCLHLTSSNDQRYVLGMITSLRSKYMTSGYNHGRLITSWRERAYRICRLWVITAKCVLNM